MPSRLLHLSSPLATALRIVDGLKDVSLATWFILRNLFGNEACVTLLIFKTQSEHLGVLKSFLIFLNMIREDELLEIESDNYVLEELRKL